MASDEYLRRQGLLQEKEQQAQILAIKIHGMRDRIRRMTDPHRPIDEVNLSELRVEMDAYTEAQERREVLIGEIASLREDMGLPRYQSR